MEIIAEIAKTYPMKVLPIFLPEIIKTLVGFSSQVQSIASSNGLTFHFS